MSDELNAQFLRGPTHGFSWSGVQRQLFFCLVLAICAVVLLVHLPVLSKKATLYDDRLYVTANPLVQNPSWQSARQFLTEVWRPSTVPGYYHPLAMISLMVDRCLAGPHESMRMYHRTSLLLHIANTALLAVFLNLLFAQPVIAAGVALLFGLHPLTVDSVCWLSERKTVLASFFALWSLVAYVRYVRGHGKRHYVSCIVGYILALLSKPIALPLPLAMLLLDYWPLDRLRRRSTTEKLPLFAVMGVFTVIGYVSQRRASWILLPGQYNLLQAPLTLCHNLVFYACKLVWPVHLSPHYEPTEPIDPSNPRVVISVVATCALLLLLLLSLRRTRALLGGCLIFLVMLSPAAGIVSHTIVLVANRYLYLPAVGLLVMMAWLLRKFSGVSRQGAFSRGSGAVLALVLVLAWAEGFATRQYLRHWGSTTDLYEYILSLFPDSSVLHNDLGVALKAQGKREQAAEHFRAAVRADPASYRAHHNLALVLDELGGHTEEVIRHHRRASQLSSGLLPCRLSLGWVLFRASQECEGLANLRQAAELAPKSARVQYNYATMLMMAEQPEEGLRYMRKALELAPRLVPVLKDLAWFLATHPEEQIRDPNEAVRVAEQARALTGDRDVGVLDATAAAYASAGQYARAVEIGRQAVAAATRIGRRETAEEITKRLHLYESGQPHHEDPRVQLDRLLTEAKRDISESTQDDAQKQNLREMQDEAAAAVAE
jgi:tetratricopeptide (TPR) repeat protein